jgi:hypothetical protein
MIGGDKMARSTFTELANATLSNKRQAVISRLDDNSYTIGQRVEINDNGNVMNVFLKGALHAENLDALQNLRDALNVVLDKERK